MNHETFSYAAQLDWLRQQIATKVAADNPTYNRMLLSLAQSVKTAREHNLNCRRPFGEGEKT